MIINSNENGARLLFEQHAPDKIKSVLSINAAALHIVIVGLNDFSKALMLHAAKIGHYINNNKLKISFIHDHKKQAEKWLQQHYPTLSDIIELNYYASLTIFSETQFIKSVAVAYVCNQSLEIAVANSLLLENKLNEDSQIVLTIFSHSEVNKVLLNHPSFKDNCIKTFNLLKKVCNKATILETKQDEQAIKYHQNYLKTLKKQGKQLGTTPNTQPWEKLPESLRDSNRYLVDHLFIKLRTFNLLNAIEITDLTDENWENLGIMEHNRWVAERKLSGWTYAKEKNIKRKQTPYVVPWKKLSAQVKSWDIAAVEESLRVHFLSQTS